MAEKEQADVVLSRKAFFVRCFLRAILHRTLPAGGTSLLPRSGYYFKDEFRYFQGLVFPNDDLCIFSCILYFSIAFFYCIILIYVYMIISEKIIVLLL